MRKGFAIAAIAGLWTFLAMGAARADNVFIFLRQVGVNGGDATLVASGTNVASFSGSYGPFFTINLAAGFAPTDPLLLHSALATSVGTIPSGNPQLVVAFYVTELAPPSSGVQPFSSTFTSSIQGSISQNMSTYVNLRNDTAPGDETFVGGTGEFRPGGPPPMIISDSLVALSAPYSLVGLFLVNTIPGPGGTSFATIDVSNISAVPGPIVGAGLPGLLLAIAGFIGWRRSRRVIAV